MPTASVKHFKTYPLQGAIPMNFSRTGAQRRRHTESSEGRLRLLKSSFVLRKQEDANKSIPLDLFILKEMERAFFSMQTQEG